MQFSAGNQYHQDPMGASGSRPIRCLARYIRWANPENPGDEVADIGGGASVMYPGLGRGSFRDWEEISHVES